MVQRAFPTHPCGSARHVVVQITEEMMRVTRNRQTWSVSSDDQR
jgi:hypothetical protein